jgi:hypothetical protein
MPLPSQFSLSVELTKFIPAASIVNVTYQAAIDIARRLQSQAQISLLKISHSSLVVTVSYHASSPLSDSREGIALPAVLRIPGHCPSRWCRTDGPPKPSRSSVFSMIVQLSLLAWCHDTDTLAASMAVACERRVRDAPPEQQHFPARWHCWIITTMSRPDRALPVDSPLSCRRGGAGA